MMMVVVVMSVMVSVIRRNANLQRLCPFLVDKVVTGIAYEAIIVSVIHWVHCFVSNAHLVSTDFAISAVSVNMDYAMLVGTGVDFCCVSHVNHCIRY